MEKLEFDKYDKREMSLEEVVVKFIVQMIEEEQAVRYKNFPEDLRQRNLEIAVECFKKRNISIKTRQYGQDGELEHIVYVACSQMQIEKLLSFEEGYVSYKKKTRKIKEQGIWTAPVELEFYQVKYDNRKDIIFKIVKGNELERDFVVADDELKFIKKRLTKSAYNCQNHIII